MEKFSSKTIQANVESIGGYEMRMLPIMLVLAVFSANLISGCESKQEKAQKAAEERHKKMFKTWDKDVEQWNKSRQKPSKPMWNQ